MFNMSAYPTIMLFNWFERGEINLAEARVFLQDPQSWAKQNANTADVNTPKPVLLASVAKKALASDVVGGWGGGYRNEPGGPGT